MVLSARERYLAGIGIGLLVIVAAVQLFVRPAAKRLETLRRVIPQKEADLMQLKAESAEYRALKDDIRAMKQTLGKQEKDFRVLPFLEQAQQECGLKRNVAYMRPSTVAAADGGYTETRVQIRLQEVDLQQITKFLFQIESNSSAVGVRSLRILTTPRKPTLLNADIEIATLVPTNG